MKRTISILRLAVLLISIGFASAASAGLFDEGMAAYEEGNFEVAFSALSQVAEEGGVFGALAQHALGVMYAQGKGVPQDYAQAVIWFRQAAQQGFAQAQTNLGDMYFKGLGVPQDYVQAQKWFNLAAVSGDENAIKNRDIAASVMTPAQIAEAKKLASEWQPTIN